MADAQVVSIDRLRAARAARSAVDDEPRVKKREIARLFGVSPRTIERWMNLGMPYERPYGDRGHVRFVVSRCRAWASR